MAVERPLPAAVSFLPRYRLPYIMEEGGKLHRHGVSVVAGRGERKHQVLIERLLMHPSLLEAVRS